SGRHGARARRRPGGDGSRARRRSRRHGARQRTPSRIDRPLTLARHVGSATAMDLAKAIAYLEEHENLEAKAGHIHGLSLDHMRRIAEVLGDPQTAAPVIHLTGTNGKGSTARLISA